MDYEKTLDKLVMDKGVSALHMAIYLIEQFVIEDEDFLGDPFQEKIGTAWRELRRASRILDVDSRQ